MNDEKAAPRRSGSLVVALILLLLVGLAISALCYFGKFQPLFQRMGRLAPATPPPTVVAPEIAPVKPVAEVVPPAAQTQAPSAKAQESAAAAAYRAKFKPPKIGGPMNLALANGQKLPGALAGLDDKAVRISTKNVIITVERDQLAPVALAACYEDEYVKYMIALQARLVEEEKQRDALIAKLKADYEKQRTKGKGSVSTDDVDFKAWMEKQGDSAMLKARQKRVAEYEAERRAAGREY